MSDFVLALLDWVFLRLRKKRLKNSDQETLNLSIE
jgi:hypothetical protein